MCQAGHHHVDGIICSTWLLMQEDLKDMLFFPLLLSLPIFFPSEMSSLFSHKSSILNSGLEKKKKEKK